MANLDPRSDNISDKLASLDSEFNTNKSFGLMGVLEGTDRNTTQNLQTRNDGDDLPGDDEGKSDELTPPDWYAPLNTSLQTLKEELKQENRGQLNELASSLMQNMRGTQTEAHDPGVPDEFAPVMGKVDHIAGEMNQLKLQSAYDRAKNSLLNAKLKRKDFDYTDKELDTMWRQNIGNDVGRATAVNWDEYFEVQYASRQTPKLAAENEKLRAEMEKLKSARTSNSVQDLYSVPRSNRTTTPPASSTNAEGFDEDLYQSVSKKFPRGKFLGFNRALADAQRKRLLA